MNLYNNPPPAGVSNHDYQLAFTHSMYNQPIPAPEFVEEHPHDEFWFAVFDFIYDFIQLLRSPRMKLALIIGLTQYVVLTLLQARSNNSVPPIEYWW